MPKPNTPLRLAKTRKQWSEVDDVVADCVKTLVARYDDSEQVQSFLTLLDLMTNEKYSERDRQSVAYQAVKVAFRYTPECTQARNDYMKELVFPNQQRRTA